MSRGVRMIRTLHAHKVNGLNEALHVTALDAPGPGGANHQYMINLPDWTRNPDGSSPHHVWDISFQNGPIYKPEDMNGISNEALLAVLIDRMRGFQHLRKDEAGEFDFASRGKYACKENACALTHLEEALMWLQKRTRDRMARGVEGSIKV